MKGIRPYLVLLLLLAALSVYLLLSRKTGSYAPSEKEFAVTDTGEIVSVKISDRDDVASLQRAGGGWTVNGNPARKDRILGMYILVSRIEVEAPVSKPQEARVLSLMETNPTRVEIGMRKGGDKVYNICFDSVSGATFMMLRNSGIPFRVRIRGYRQTDLERLFRTDARYWRDNIMFAHRPDEIRTVSLHNKREPDRSFHLMRNEDGEFGIARGAIPAGWQSPAEESVSQYLGYFYDVRFEAFLYPGGDTLYRADSPDYILEVGLRDRTSRRLELYPDYRGRELRRDQLVLDRLTAKIGPGDEWVVVKYVQVDPLLKDFEYFAGL
jgi:hypothetical protein